MKRLNAVSVMERLDVSSKETIRQMVKRGLLPPPIKDEGGCCNYWMESWIDQYLQSLADKRDSKAAERATV